MLGDIELSINAATICDANLLTPNDLSIGIPKQRVMVRLIDGATAADRTVRVC